MNRICCSTKVKSKSKPNICPPNVFLFIKFFEDYWAYTNKIKYIIAFCRSYIRDISSLVINSNRHIP